MDDRSRKRSPFTAIRPAVIVVHPVEMCPGFILFVVADFMPHEQENEDTGGKAEGKASDLNAGVHFLARHRSPGNLEIVLKHGDRICLC